MEDDPILRVRVSAATIEALRSFLDDTEPDMGRRPIVRKTDAGYTSDAYFHRSHLTAARGTRAAEGVILTEIDNASELGRERQASVGQGNRFAARAAIPLGLGRKVP